MAAIDKASSGMSSRQAMPCLSARTHSTMAISAMNSQVSRGTTDVPNGLRKNSAGKISKRLSDRTPSRPTDMDIPTRPTNSSSPSVGKLTSPAPWKQSPGERLRIDTNECSLAPFHHRGEEPA